MSTRVLYAAAAALALASCDLFTGPELPGRSKFIVSDPAAELAGSSGQLATAADEAVPVAYVSLPPATVPDGVSASLFNQATLGGVSIPVVDGGFDPVPIPASPGDTIEIVIRSRPGAAPTTLKYEVPGKRRPVVVRTSPPRGKTDVVLNSLLTVVFSEPVVGATVTTESIRLILEGATVTGSVELAADGLTARFRPEARLRANTAYTLQVTTGIIDLDGDALEAPVSVRFHTGATVAEGVSMTLAPNPLRSVPGDGLGPWGHRVPLRATVRDAAGDEITPTGWLQWRSSDATVVEFWGSGSYIGEQEVVAHVGEVGTATISAALGGLSASTTVVIEDVAWGAVTVGVNGLTCYLTAAGAAYCTGSNHLGQLGIGFTSYSSESPIGVEGDIAFEAISSGWDHSCGLTSAGHAYCWGDNSYGELGDGTLVSVRPAPVLVDAGGVPFEQIGAGWSHTCALSPAGKAYCWGTYGWAVIDSITTDPAAVLGPVPVAVPGDLAFTLLSVGGAHACGLDAEGLAYCWGLNMPRALGVGSVDRSYSPVVVPGGHRFVHLDAGGPICGVTAAGEVYCWSRESAPERIELPSGVALTSIAAGKLTCGLTAEGAAYCWGTAYPCSSCDEVTIPPQRVSALTFRSLSTGAADGVCGVTSGGRVDCWLARDLLP